MPFLRERILGGLWGSVVGDALGVPVEFRTRAQVQADPVSGMRGFGTHQQPPGTWSDDASLLLCSTESLLSGFNVEDMASRFVAWYRDGLWTAHGELFDIGMATAEALDRVSQGVSPEQAGGRSESSNGNGSLMRMLPIILAAVEAPMEDMLAMVHASSRITHGHPRSLMACGYQALFVKSLCAGLPAFEAYRKTGMEFRRLYGGSEWQDQMGYFRRILTGDLQHAPEDQVKSSGYCMHTLEASLWCLLNTRSFNDCVLRAVNLGEDSDTTGCVAGGLAGVAYGLAAVPEPWRMQLARTDDLKELFERFADTLEAMP